MYILHNITLLYSNVIFNSVNIIQEQIEKVKTENDNSKANFKSFSAFKFQSDTQSEDKAKKCLQIGEEC